MSSVPSGKDNESGSPLKQSGLRKPHQTTRDKLQNGLGTNPTFRISSVFL